MGLDSVREVPLKAGGSEVRETGMSTVRELV
jgi:hypothetical protein